jgi:hypothetical protein
MKRTASFLMLLVAAALGACAPAGETASSPRSHANRLTIEDIERNQYLSAYDMIQALRPNWLRGRGQQSFMNPTAGQVMVYVDGSRMGGPDTLRQLRADDVQEVQFLSPNEAGSRFGLDHTGGAILVVTRR